MKLAKVEPHHVCELTPFSVVDFPESRPNYEFIFKMDIVG